VELPRNANLDQNEAMGALAKTGALPRRRWRIGALLGIGVLVNYLDRLNLSVAAPQLQSAFNLSPAQVGWFLSAFFWSYALCQVPAGVLLDRLGPTRVAGGARCCGALPRR
jgi:sugar phosphate permease